MILIDALYINTGGGLGLLKYLVEKMILSRKDFFLLYDDRCKGLFEGISHKKCLISSISNRKWFYKKHKDDYSSVFCFANVPPPIRLKVPVYTYFHNINMLTLGDDNLKSKAIWFVKRYYLHTLKSNTDKWIVQTANTANELFNHLHLEKDDIDVLPFYNLKYLRKYQKHGNDYVFIGNYTGSKGHDELLSAWRLLHQKEIDLTLHLTCSMTDKFLNDISNAQREGVNIINHGYVSYEKVDELYRESKVLIYPSSNESLGLGIIEAIHSGCDVISSDLPFTHAICKPSGVFDPHSPESIANAVIQYENCESQRSVLIIQDEIDKIIGLLN